MQTRQNFTLYERQDQTLIITVTDEAGAAVALASTMSSATWNVGPRLDASEALISKTTGAGGIVLSDLGTATITILKTDTDLIPGVYYHELLVQELNTARMYSVTRGLVTVRPSVVTTP